MITATSPRKLDPYGRTWERIISITLQPNTVPYRPVKGAAPLGPDDDYLREIIANATAAAEQPSDAAK
jgi:hypothetical protein